MYLSRMGSWIWMAWILFSRRLLVKLIGNFCLRFAMIICQYFPYSLFSIKDNTTENVRLVVELLLYSIQDFICPSRQIDMPSGLEFQYFEIQKTFVSVSYMFYPWWYVSRACHIPSPVLVRLQPLNTLSALWSELNWWDGSHLDPNIE